MRSGLPPERMVAAWESAKAPRATKKLQSRRTLKISLIHRPNRDSLLLSMASISFTTFLIIQLGVEAPAVTPTVCMLENISSFTSFFIHNYQL